MIFLTVGTQFPFDRLVKSVDEVVNQNGVEEEIFGQIGQSTYQPRNFKAVSYLEKHLFDAYMTDASCIISHAGIGTITTALEENKPLLVMPRRQIYQEVVNDHQVAIAQKFEQLGYILVAYEISDLPNKVKELKHFVPKKRCPQAKAVADRITKFLINISEKD
jgi:UDP-N-acetylglucosamine transferase subunit ALG13